MKFFYIAFNVILLIILFFQLVVTIRKDNNVSKPLGILLVASIFTIGFYNFTLTADTPFLAELYYCLYLTTLDFALLILFQFTLTVTGRNCSSIKYPILRDICISIIILDAIFLISQLYFNQIFEVEQIQNNLLNMKIWVFKPKLPVAFHYFVSYSTVTAILIRLIYKISTSAKFFSQRYATMFWSFLIITFLHLISTLYKWTFDFSICIFPFLCFICYYFSFISIPSHIKATILKQLTESTESIFLCYNKENKLIFTNKKAADLFAANPDFETELKKLHLEWCESLQNQDEDSKQEIKLFNSLDEKIIFSVEFYRFRDKRRRVIGNYIKLDDRTKEINKLNIQTYKTQHDYLTDLYNRNTFFKECEKILESNPDRQYYMIATNIKNFKLLNELFTQKFADEILVLEASSIKRLGFVAGRISSDKFGIIAEKTDDLHEKLQSISDDLQLISKNLNYKMILYIGIYEIANIYENIQSMYDKANLAIKKIYGTYETSIVYYNLELMENLLKQKNIIAGFNKAIENDEFMMYLQPQFDANTDQCLGAEALVRWNHPTRGILTPDNFVSIFERGGYIFKMDKIIWEKAAQKLKEWQEKGWNHYISVNISAKDFYYGDLYEIFTNLTREYGISPAKMNLEITETVLMHDENYHKKVIDRLKAFGFKIEMDDFGSGYSSLSSLKNLEMDVLKIDMEFLGKTENPERSEKILSAIIKMAKKLGMSVITEGVEYDSQVQLLKNLGSDIFQGYRYNKPISCAEYEKKYLISKGEA